MQYVAFLRGINLGKRQVKMEDLQDVFLHHNLSTVRTLIASGNVLFETAENDEKKLQQELEKSLAKRFGFTIPVILRSMENIHKLVKSKPFEEIASLQAPRNDNMENNSRFGLHNNDSFGEKGFRLHITFFSDKIKEFDPIHKNGFMIQRVDEKTLASVVYPEGKTTDLMTFIDKTFGKNSTTRNWNTILKVFR